MSCIKLLIIIVFSVHLFLINCGEQSSRDNKKMTSEIIQYLALGDSYTIGESVQKKERWPVQLADSLRHYGFEIAEPLIIAKTGWTTDELLEGIKRINPQGTFDLVSLLIGVNNQYRSRKVEEFRVQFKMLLEQSIAFAGGNEKKVFVLSIPDWGVTPFADGRNRAQIASEIDLFNSIKKEESEKRGVLYVDSTPFSREANSDSSLVAADGLHPSGKMYTGWIKLALPSVLKMFQKNE